jgi:hypothetical protein
MSIVDNQTAKFENESVRAAAFVLDSFAGNIEVNQSITQQEGQSNCSSPNTNGIQIMYMDPPRLKAFSFAEESHETDQPRQSA